MTLESYITYPFSNGISISLPFSMLSTYFMKDLEKIKVRNVKK